MQVEWLISGTTPSWIEKNFRDGGYVYDTTAREVLRSNFDVKVTYLFRGNARNPMKRLLQLGQYIAANRRLSFSGDVVVRDLFSTVFSPFDGDRKHIVMLHHFDPSAFRNRVLATWFAKRLFAKACQADAVVVVSKYWQKILQSRGCRNVDVIYNSFDLTKFQFSSGELESFRQEHGFPIDRPIVYLGNARTQKGFEQAYEALKNTDAILVTTGKGTLNIPVWQRYLSYRDYLKLLNISTVAVTMSQFPEGWCRTAHEAMLCGTPVVGSGQGGMGELLREGEQTICEDFSELRSALMRLLNDSASLLQMSTTGQNYAIKFSHERFEESWMSLMSSLAARSHRHPMPVQAVS